MNLRTLKWTPGQVIGAVAVAALAARLGPRVVRGVQARFRATQGGKIEADDSVDLRSMHSFLASDPPSFTPITSIGALSRALGGWRRAARATERVGLA